MAQDDNSLNFDGIDRTAIEAAGATVYETLTATAQISWPLLSEACGCEVWVKHENHLPTGAFKVRGGLVYMDHLKSAQPDVPGVITATRGNHGQSIAFAARALGIPATVVVPHGNSPAKNRAMIGYGAELIEQGRDFQAAMEIAETLANARNLHFVPSFHWRLVRGVATGAYEFLRAAPELEAVYLPIGLGSGICGMAAAKRALGHGVEVIGVSAARANAYALSFAAGHAVTTETSDTIADGIATRVPNPHSLEVILREVSRVVTVSEEEILRAMRLYFTTTHQAAEGAGAAPLAALLQEREMMAGKKTGLVLSGGNVDTDLFTKALKSGE